MKSLLPDKDFKIFPSVYLVDDDASVRKALARLIRSAGLEVQTFASAREFLDRIPDTNNPACLVADVRMPGLSGIDLHHELRSTNRNLPIIFVTGHGDIPMSVNAMKAGAVEFLTKPFRDQDLLDAVPLALDRDRLRRSREHQTATLNGRLKLLTARERELLPWVVSGRPNKEIAAELGMSEGAVKVALHRLRKRFGAVLRSEIAHTVSTAEEVDDEIRHLFAAISTP